MAKDRDGTFVQLPVQKLTEVHINTSKKLPCILYIIKKKYIYGWLNHPMALGGGPATLK
jgi:hypothetical protein